MKKFLLRFNVLMIAVVIACQSARPSTDNSMLNPGDEIDGMVITTGAAEAPPLWAFCPPASETDNTVTMDCELPPLPKLAIGHTFGAADRALQTLDWSEATWKVSLDGHLVDLSAFGTYDFVFPDLSKPPSPIREVFRNMKIWDVMLENPTPGMHTLHGIVQTEGNIYTWIVNFTVLFDKL
ncbi:MAG TPA: hypothetical protein VFY83_17300 [Anaerolineales bacterium]|nr:hypothetical protein [Anaerolineales bacterium]